MAAGNFKLNYSGTEINTALAWVFSHRTIEMDVLQNTGETTEMSTATARSYDLILVHGYVANAGCPNQGMLIFDPALITWRDSNTHGCFSSTIWRGKPGDPENGAPIAIEVMLKDGDENTIIWTPCYNSYYGTGIFYARKIIGLKAETGVN